MNNENPNLTQQKKLFSLANEIANINPWQTIEEDLVFGVKLPDVKETGYIHLITAFDDIFGIMIYRGEVALNRVRQFNRQHNMVELNMFSLIFEDPNSVPQEVFLSEYSTLNDIYSNPLGSPIFMSHTPGCLPERISENEASLLIEYLEQAVKVYRQNKTKQFFDLNSNNMKCFYRIFFMDQWKNSVEDIPPSPETKDSFKLNSSLLKKLWKLPPTKGMQASLFLFPGSIGQPDEKRTTAYLLLLHDEETGYIEFDLLAPENSLREMELSVPNKLLKIIIKMGNKPKFLLIPEGNKLFDIISEAGIKKFPFLIKVAEDELQLLESISEKLWNSVLPDEATLTNMEAEEEEEEETLPQVKPTGKILQIKVALLNNKRTYRKIAIRDDQTLDALHEAIFDAFDREEDHLYSFFFPNKATKSKRVIIDSIEYTIQMEDSLYSFKETEDSLTATIASLRLKEKQKFYYLFDWGDEWWHELTFEGESTTKKKKFPAIIMSKGESPPQYPDWEE